MDASAYTLTLERTDALLLLAALASYQHRSMAECPDGGRLARLRASLSVQIREQTRA